MPDWTYEQKQAIDSRDGTILVSAAAGSGKTTVLVERVIRRLENELKPCSVDKLLIVTFTKAATAQMKEKIVVALDKRLESDPDNEHILRQRMLMPFANISTIDSFCSQLVRSNFQLLGISPDFTLLEQAQLSLMKNDAVNNVIERAYKENSPQFRQLLDLLVTSGNDSNLCEIIISLFDDSRAFPYPEVWLDGIVESYDKSDSACSSIWGQVVIHNIRQMLEYCSELVSSALSVLEKDDPEGASKFTPLFTSYNQYFSEYMQLLGKGNWDEIRDFAGRFVSGRVPPKVESLYAPRAKAIKAEVVDVITKRLPKLLCCTQEEFFEDIEYARPVILKLVELVKDFSEEFKAIKSASNGVDFNDVVDYAISLLVKELDENGNPVKTDLAVSLSQQFDEILVDEFQDINETQNLLFKAISKDESNLFMVGDVKQSIYRFRQAMPRIFLERREGLKTYTDGNYPAKINLDYNFRSRSGVTGYVNFLFERLMSIPAGELEYDDSEALKPKADYPSSGCPDAEIHIISDVNQKAAFRLEGEYIAKYINDAISSGLMVKDGDIQRKAQYRDFCILLRSPKNKAPVYASALTDAGVPCHITSNNGFFDAVEVKTALAMIRTIDNPQQDVPLVTTMLSPSFGFTPDELADFRINSRKTSYYTCVKTAADNGNKKCIRFLESLDKLRMLSVTLGAGDFVRELLDVTGYSAYVLAMENGSQRGANLEMLLEYAQKYEKSGNVGVSGFIRFIDKVEENDGDMEIANEISENADVVRIMSIHKSKGLEFPVCILADCASNFREDFYRHNIIYNPVRGVATKRVDSFRKFETLAFKAVQLEELRATRSEELRVLYVALTRAKERLVCIIREDNIESKLSKLSAYMTGGRINPYKVLTCRSYADWILLASADHPDFAAKTEAAPFIDFDAKFGLNVKLINLSQEINEGLESKLAPPVDDELTQLLKKRLSYEYPYGNLSDIVAKVSPSALDDSADSMKYFAASVPDFVYKDGMSSASKGTAMHKFMEFYDYSASLDVKQQAERMVSNKKLSSAEEKVLDYKNLARFFDSDIAKEIAASKELLREKKVTITVPASEIYPDICKTSANEQILVQGYIDCAFIRNGKWVIVDYKTDRVESLSELKERYYNQLKMYERALRLCTGIDVDCTVIYSLHLGQTLKI